VLWGKKAVTKLDFDGVLKKVSIRDRQSVVGGIRCIYSVQCKKNGSITVRAPWILRRDNSRWRKEREGGDSRQLREDFGGWCWSRGGHTLTAVCLFGVHPSSDWADEERV